MTPAWLAVMILTTHLSSPSPSTSADVYELPLPVSGAQLVQAERHEQGTRWVVFIPGDAHPVSIAKRYSAGPIRGMRMRSVAHGLVVTLTPDPASHLTLASLQLLATPQAHVRVALSAVATPPTRAAPTAAAAIAVPPPLPQPLPAAVALEPPTEFKKPPAPATLKTLPMVCTLVVGGLIMGWLAWRKKHLAQASAHTIELLAVRAFGTKHKLALIETCGERLLLAISDRQVTLLSHLTSAALDDVQTDADLSTAQPHDAGGATVTPIRPVCDDVQGLLKIYQGTG